MQGVNLDNVRKFMVENEIDEQRLAEKMGVSYSFVFRVMRGDRLPGGKFIEGLLKIGMPPKDIFLPTAIPNGNDATLEEGA